ncbi:YbaK/EbsC family protein [Limnospira fusiformis]|uniref:YbaK/EbsC family protein n=1 Tax=Limnospira fusiformis TaxID=54297 RepID=UPI001448AB00|nr:YbaK/prolyl-tRNA synthetase associated domain-containing protein [Limnospira fusiformis SAG 85.79]
MNTPNFNVYEAIISLLDKHHANYHVLDHEPEGQSELVSQIRGNDLSQGAKAMVLMVKVSKKTSQYYLAVIPANKQIDFDAIKELCPGAKRVMFAPPEKAEKLTNCTMGAVPPFSFHPELNLVVDPLLLKNEVIVFNAGKLDKSIFLSSESYIKTVNPQIKNIVK